MSQQTPELQCECARCGKSVYHTIQWLRDHATLRCVGCETVISCVEILKENSRTVLKADEAARRESK
jgi:hypothetical protein